MTKSTHVAADIDSNHGAIMCLLLYVIVRGTQGSPAILIFCINTNDDWDMSINGELRCQGVWLFWYFVNNLFEWFYQNEKIPSTQCQQ